MVGRRAVVEGGIFIYTYISLCVYFFNFFLFQSQKLKEQVVRSVVFVVPAAGMVHPTCRLGVLE